VSEADERIHDHLAELAAVPPDGCVVDLGCGSGPTLAALARWLPSALLIGFDRSAASVDAARGILADHAGLLEASPLTVGRVDTWVTSSTELSGHAARRVENIRDALRSSALKGRGIVSLAEIEAWREALQQAAEQGRFFFAETTVVVFAFRAP